MKRSSFITWDQLKVGVVILAALGVLAVAIYKLGQAANLFIERYELVAYLANANGLRAGGTVLVAGQFAGTIKSIEFLPVDNDTTRNLRLRLGDRRVAAASRSAPTPRPRCARSACSATR